MSDHLTPLEVCERLLGAFPDLERIAGYRPKAAYAWRRATRNRRAGWLPPEVSRRFLAYAQKRGIPLIANDLVAGVSRAKLERRLAEVDRSAPPLEAAE